jgi:hypothetical protein
MYFRDHRMPFLEARRRNAAQRWIFRFLIILFVVIAWHFEATSLKNAMSDAWDTISHSAASWWSLPSTTASR